ncbi:hypothetical protein G4D61_11170 [Bacillus ginsengihumi]|uniref:Uncharacterized protein n=1 Tax=Heyndrickxia ginsengihumi TaxID=363870 RepID=A0A6M0P748_9BACI|nr:hypothetical protein [Heyndrickxia ginsengihumi]NEY20516.1 hypothetical protein [Heyndrickxia ginsengihumi]
MPRVEREMMVEWLHICTGYSREFWDKCTDKQLEMEYKIHVIEGDQWNE